MKTSMGGYMGVAGLLACGALSCKANPTGGQVAGGSASITTVPGVVTINQSSNTAVINWQTFSIGAGELTKFVQPSAVSATLNRVLGGQVSTINGTLSANGQVYLVNGNGIVIGPGGVVNANAFTASTRDISNADFLAGNLHFSGDSGAGVQNFGAINALGGDVYLLGKTVENAGAINAPNGTAALAAGDDILLAQKNADGSTVTVNPSATATSASGKTGVSNSGSIAATNAELKAANGNLYALAINNSGSIRATTVRHQGGHIFLTSDSGKLVNSGVLNASATVRHGKGGIVSLKNATGETVESGSIIATGGQFGKGGEAEVSGHGLQFTGNVDLTAPDGTTGMLVLDPYNITIVSTGQSTTVPDGNGNIGGGGNGSVLNVNDLEAALANSNVTVFTGISSAPGTDIGDITVNAPITWNSASTLVLSAADKVFINANITAPNGGLSFNTAIVTGGTTGNINPAGVTGNINVGSFSFISGQFQQNATTLPTFTASNFNPGGGTFLRSQGGNGTQNNPYVIVDTFGDQGLNTLPQGTFFVYGNGFVGTHTPNGNTGGGGGGTTTGTGTPTVTSILSNPVTGPLVSSFLAYTANPPPTQTFSITVGVLPGGELVVLEPESGGGGVNNGGSSKKGTNIASGSSVTSKPTPNALLLPGSGIASMFGGTVNAAQVSPFIVRKFDIILNAVSEGELNAAAFGH